MTVARWGTRRPGAFVAACCLAAGLLCTGAAVAHAQTPAISAEDWIVQELRAGHPANFDLQAQGYADDTAVLSAAFVSELMANTRPDVKLDRHGLTIAHANIGRRVAATADAAPEFDDLDLANAEVPFDVTLLECQIGAINATGAMLKRNLSLTGSTLRGLDLTLAQAQEDISLDRATILGPLTMNTASLAGLLTADHVVIQGNTNFNQATVKSGLFVPYAQFLGPIDAIDLTTSYLDATMAGFADTSTNGRQFARMHINTVALFHGATFASQASFFGAQFGGDADFSKAQFATTDSLATDFSSTRVGGHFNLGDTLFSGPARFELADIVTLDAGAANFADRDSGADFEGMKVARDGNFAGATFAGPLTLTDSAFGGNLYFTQVTWPSTRSLISLGNMHYHDLFVSDSVDATQGTNSWDSVGTLFNAATYWPQNYTDIEAYYKSLGKIEDAKAAFVDGRRKQRLAVSDIRQALPWTADVLLDRLLCYGRCPENVVYPSVVFVAVGTWVFWRADRMQAAKADGPQRTYYPFWFSLDVFAPVISLGVRDAWLPTTGRPWATSYMHVQTLAGWILVPIGLAAVTGLLK